MADYDLHITRLLAQAAEYLQQLAEQHIYQYLAAPEIYVPDIPGIEERGRYAGVVRITSATGAVAVLVMRGDRGTYVWHALPMAPPSATHKE